MDSSLIWKIIALVGSMLIAISGTLGVIKWQHDGPVEEIVEKVIKDQTGINVDLSPEDPDPDING